MLPVRYLMCSPEYFDVSYVINPWMKENLNKVCFDRAHKQWSQLYKTIAKLARVELVAPQSELRDMPFTANAGLILHDKVVMSRFLHPERKGEEKYFEEWFRMHQFKVYTLPNEIVFEGAGDALLDWYNRCIWAGYGHRSSLESHKYLAKWLEVETLSLRLIDGRFYHLDTCFCPLKNGYLLYFPPAFDEQSLALIAERIPASKRIIVSESDALNFACNAINIDNLIIVNKASSSLIEELARSGFHVIEVELSEFIKAGGAAKCLTLRLDETHSRLRQENIACGMREM